MLNLVETHEVQPSFCENIIKLTDLRHVIFHRDVCFPNIGRLTSLRAMPKISLRSNEGFGLHQLKHLNKLQGKLTIRCLDCAKSKEEAIEAKLTHKEQLTELKLSWGEDNKFYTREVQPEVDADVFEGLCPPEYLKLLRIRGYIGSRYPSWMVGAQKSIMHLLKLVFKRSIQPVCGPGFFFIPISSLELCCCRWDNLPDNMEDLESLTLMESLIPSNMQHLKSLKRLIIRYQFRLTVITIPTLPSSLEYIELSGCYRAHR